LTVPRSGRGRPGLALAWARSSTSTVTSTSTIKTTGLALLTLLMLAGCAGSLRPQYPLRDARQALERRDATVAALSGIRAEARVDQRAKTGRIRGTVLMFVERAGRVRFDVMTQFGPVAILTSDGSTFAYADFRANRYLTGETCPQNIARLLGVPLSAADTARFLLGGTPVLAFTRSELKLDDDGHYHLTLHADSGERQELELTVYPEDLKLPTEKQRLSLARSELFGPGPTSPRVWRVTYDAVEPVQAGSSTLLVPKRVRIEQPASDSDTLVNFKNMKTNPQIPDDAFVQSVRPGMEEEVASCD
jgi:outer membrane lipoprotein-sorting protein